MLFINLALQTGRHNRQNTNVPLFVIGNLLVNVVRGQIGVMLAEKRAGIIDGERIDKAHFAHAAARECRLIPPCRIHHGKAVRQARKFLKPVGNRDFMKRLPVKQLGRNHIAPYRGRLFRGSLTARPNRQ